MRWLYLTLGLLASCVCLLGWVYMRGRNSSWRPAEQQLARVDAQATLAALRGTHCDYDCTARLLGRTSAHHWLVRVTLWGQPRCLQIDVPAYRMSPYGMLGVQPSACAKRSGAGSATH